MSRHPLALHGRDHRPGGADPIPGITANIADITSADASIVVTDPTGPTTDLAVATYHNNYMSYETSGQTWVTGTGGTHGASFTGTAVDASGWFQKSVVAGATLVECVAGGLYAWNVQTLFTGIADKTKFVHITGRNGVQVEATFPLYAVGFNVQFQMTMVDWFEAGEFMQVTVAHDYGSTQPFTVTVQGIKVI